jgi:hypothetical protein
MIQNHHVVLDGGLSTSGSEPRVVEQVKLQYPAAAVAVENDMADAEEVEAHLV